MKAPLSVLTFALFAPLAVAHGPTPQKIDESVVIAAPPAAVWAVVGDFAGIAKWNPAIKASSADRGNEAGSTRTLTLPTGTVTEQLDDYDAAAMSMNYRSGNADPAVLPVSSYPAGSPSRPKAAAASWCGRRAATAPTPATIRPPAWTTRAR